MKVIAYYLPQFHSIPENDLWWGKGFSDWTNVKKGKKYSKKQIQPRVPLNNNYYDLSDWKNILWQAEIARQYGVYGFCIYHYWFNGKLLLEKPAELLLARKEINIHFCFSWANESWTTQWKPGKPKVIINQNYGDKEDWKRHFEYLKQFFSDKRYIFVNERPLLVIYRPELIGPLKEMLEYWNEMARENGFNGLTYAYQNSDQIEFERDLERDRLFDLNIEFQPLHYRKSIPSYAMKYKLNKFKYIVAQKITSVIKMGWVAHMLDSPFRKGVKEWNYDDAYKYILENKPTSDKCVPGAFVDWDNTARKQKRGSFYSGVSCKKFKKYFVELIRKAREEYMSEFVFVYAWNEWAEGGYLEPDEVRKFGFLEAIHDALEQTGEFPNYDDEVLHIKAASMMGS